MRNERLSPSFLLIGFIMLLGGLLLWSIAPADKALHRMFLLPPATMWVRRIVDLSALGGLAVMGPVALAVVVGLVAIGRRRDGIWLFCTVASGRLIVEGVKPLVQRPRPPVADRLELVTSWSFPSSHSAGTMMTAIAFALLAGGRSWMIAVALLAAAVIGWSRAALGVHWPSDVLAGWGFGLMWAGAAWRLYGAPTRSG